MVKSLTVSSGELPAPTPTAAPVVISGTLQPSAIPTMGTGTAFIPGKQYIDDTLIAIAKTSAAQTIVASVSRNQKETNYYQSIRVSYFDGADWKRKVEGLYTSSSAITTNAVIPAWNIEYDSSRVLKQSVVSTFSVDTKTIRVSTGTLRNEAPMRSLPGYTKFVSRGEGTIEVDGSTYPAYIMYSRIYSSNSPELLAYGENMGVTTDWVVYFDTDGTMYHVDKTDVRNPSPLYQSHSIAFSSSPTGVVSTTFDVNVTRSAEHVPLQYAIQLGAPVNTQLRFSRLNLVDKASDANTIWVMGQIKGENGGVGLVEYIKE